jgi:hypothetical protein
MGILVFLVGGALIATGLFGGRSVTRQTRAPLMGMVTRLKALGIGLVLVTLVLMSRPQAHRPETPPDSGILFGSATSGGVAEGGLLPNSLPPGPSGAVFDSVSTDSAAAAP